MKKENIYIVPSKIGLIYTGVLFTIFLIGLTYTNNLTLITAFIMLTFFITQMLKSHQLVKKLNIESMNVKDDFSDNLIKISTNIPLNIDHKLVKNSFYYEKKEFTPENLITLETNITSQLNLTRGEYHFDKVKFYSYGHSSLFYVWKYFKINKTFYVYPKRISNDQNQITSIDIAQNTINEEEFSHHIPYVPGMTAKRIDWNIFAKSEQLYWKKHIGSNNDKVVIDLDKLHGDLESRLSHAAFFIDYLYKNNHEYSIKSKGKTSVSAKGSDHHKYCLEQLSKYQ
jgi:hypothetical protein